MKKFLITVSYIAEAKHDLGAVFVLNRALYPLGESELARFDVLDVVEIVEE